MTFLSHLDMDLGTANTCFPEMTWPITVMLIKRFSHAKSELDA